MALRFRDGRDRLLDALLARAIAVKSPFALSFRSNG